MTGVCVCVCVCVCRRQQAEVRQPPRGRERRQPAGRPALAFRPHRALQQAGQPDRGLAHAALPHRRGGALAGGGLRGEGMGGTGGKRPSCRKETFTAANTAKRSNQQLTAMKLDFKTQKQVLNV